MLEYSNLKKTCCTSTKAEFTEKVAAHKSLGGKEKKLTFLERAV